MAKLKLATSELRAEILRQVASIPEGKFTTYGSIARHFGVNPRQVASVMSRLTEAESEVLPWQRVLGAEARISPNMPPEGAAEQRSRLAREGFTINARGYLQNADRHFYVVR